MKDLRVTHLIILYSQIFDEKHNTSWL